MRRRSTDSCESDDAAGLEYRCVVSVEACTPGRGLGLCGKVGGIVCSTAPSRSMSTVKPRLSLSLFLSVMLALCTAHAATLDQAAALLRDGQLERADHAIAQVLAAQPDSARAHYLDARLLAAEGKWPLAERELERARRLDPTLGFAPRPQVRALANEVLQHRWKNPKGLAGYGQAALAVLFILVSGYVVFGMLRGRRKPPKA